MRLYDHTVPIAVVGDTMIHCFTSRLYSRGFCPLDMVRATNTRCACLPMVKLTRSAQPTHAGSN